MPASSQPWMKFYPADWRSDPRLRMCSLAARGLWMEMIALMHEAQPYGHLLIAGRRPTDAQLSALVGAPPDLIPDLVRELEAAGVFSRTREKVIFSRRMVADDKKARISRKNGKSGGNPSLCKTKENQPWDNPGVKGVDKAQKPEARSQNITAAEDASGREEFSGPDLESGPSTALSAEEPSPADGLIQAFDAAILTAWGPEAVRVVVPGDDRTASRWVDAGVTPEQVRRVAGRVFDRMRRAGRTPPKALGYLTDSLTEDMTSAATPLLVPKPAQMVGAVAGSDPEDAKWQARMSGWRRNRFWSADLFGPAPGEPGCRVPAKYLNAEMVQ